MINIENEPCSEGDTHIIGTRELEPSITEVYCTKCELGWVALTDLILARYLPPANIAINSRWRGSTYEWEYNGTEWNIHGQGPEDMSILNDLPLRPVTTTYGSIYDKNESSHSRACQMKTHPHGKACHPNCPTCHGDKL